jgi:hypothetical protein
MAVIATIVLAILLVLYSLQALAKFVIWLLVPYPARIRRISSYYDKDSRTISIYDTVSLLSLVLAVALLLVVGAEPISFLTGLIVGMLLVQTFFHRFDRPLTPDRAPVSPAPVRKVLSFAIQDAPLLAWREMLMIAVLLVGSLVGLGWAVVSRLSV